MTAHYQWLWEHHARSWCWETLPLLHIREQQLTSLAWMSLHRFWLQLRVLILLAIPETYRGESNFGYIHHILCPWTQGLDLGLLSHGQVSSLKRSSANPLLSPHTCPGSCPSPALGWLFLFTLWDPAVLTQCVLHHSIVFNSSWPFGL